MICRTHHVPTTDRLQEIVQSRERDFPYVAMESDLNRFEGLCSPWHWHDHFEFAMIINGSMELQTRGFHRILQAGEAYFINSNVLHLCRAAEDQPLVRLHVQLFDRSLIAGTGFIARRYIAPIENAASLEACTFNSDEAQGKALCSALQEAFAAAELDTPGSEMDIVRCLIKAWSLLYRQVSPALKAGNADVREEVQRTKAMLNYIHENYSQPITIRKIAAAAGVSERECFRCFAGVLDTTPRAYLSQYRIAMSMRLLAESSMNITEIAYACGFSNSSYFGKVFRQLTGCTPKEFRKE